MSAPEPTDLAISSRVVRKQIERDADYARDYNAWLLTLSPAERASLKDKGIDRPDASRHVSTPYIRPNAVLLAEMIDESQTLYHHTQAGPDERNEVSAAASEAMARFLHWVVIPHPRGGINPKAIAQRALAAMWVLRPDLIGNRTLTELATLLNAKPEVVSRQASAFSARFHVTGRSQFSQDTRKAMRRSAKARSLIPDAPADPSVN